MELLLLLFLYSQASEGQIPSCCTPGVTSSCFYLPELAAKRETYPVFLIKGHVEVCMRDMKGQRDLGHFNISAISTTEESD